MGNAIAKKFDNVPKDHTATAGHLQLWKIWPGTVKEANISLGTQIGDEISIWSYDKSELSKKKSNPTTDKAILEQVFLSACLSQTYSQRM